MLVKPSGTLVQGLFMLPGFPGGYGPDADTSRGARKLEQIEGGVGTGGAGGEGAIGVRTLNADWDEADRLDPPAA